MSSEALEKSVPSSEKTQFPVQVFQEMERRDEKQILAEMAGELVQDFVYDIVLQGKHVTNLSICGVHEAIRQRGNVQELEVTVEETEKEYRARVRIRDLEKNVDWVGGSTCEKDKPFAYVLALNKAERNAYRKVIPEKWIATLIHEYLDRRKSTKSEVGEEKQAADTGTSPALESPVPIQPSPSKELAAKKPEKPAERPRMIEGWEVPVSLETQMLPRLEREEIKRDGHNVGVRNILDDEAAFIIAKPVDAQDYALTSFLQNQILEAMKGKHAEEFQYQYVVQDGMFYALLVRAKDPKEILNLNSPCSWAFLKALTRDK